MPSPKKGGFQAFIDAQKAKKDGKDKKDKYNTKAAAKKAMGKK